MSNRTRALLAVLVMVASISANQAWADRGGRFDRGHGFERSADRGRGHGPHMLGWGLGLLAGSAVLLAASQPRPVVVAAPPVIYAPPVASVAVYSPPAVQWWYYCAQQGAYYPHVNYCPSGWSKVPAIPQ